MGKFLVFPLLVIAAIFGQLSADEKMLGTFFGCDHELKGDIYAVHKRQLKIKAFTFDGLGPGSWLTALKKPYAELKGIFPVGQDYVILPVQHPMLNDSCDILFWKGNRQEGTELTVDLPDDVTAYSVLSVYCHAFCNNFGHVIIPTGLTDADFDPIPTTNYTLSTKTCVQNVTIFAIKNEPYIICDEKGKKKNDQLDACGTIPVDGAGQFQPSTAMIFGVLCFGLISRYGSK